MRVFFKIHTWNNNFPRFIHDVTTLFIQRKKKVSLTIIISSERKYFPWCKSSFFVFYLFLLFRTSFFVHFYMIVLPSLPQKKLNVTNSTGCWQQHPTNENIIKAVYTHLPILSYHNELSHSTICFCIRDFSSKNYLLSKVYVFTTIIYLSSMSLSTYALNHLHPKHLFSSIFNTHMTLYDTICIANTSHHSLSHGGQIYTIFNTYCCVEVYVSLFFYTEFAKNSIFDVHFNNSYNSRKTAENSRKNNWSWNKNKNLKCKMLIVRSTESKKFLKSHLR